MRKGWLVVLGVCIAIPAAAHDFWLQPARFWVAPGAPTAMSILVGHGSDRQLWDAEINRVSQVQSVGPTGVTPQRGTITQGGQGIMRFTAPGVHVVSLQTNHSQSDLPALRFNDYLKTEGLTPAIEHRRRTRQTDAPGKEIYSRRAKALVRVGTGTLAPSPHVTTSLGQTLEIVPIADPYAVAANRSLPFRIEYKGRPLAGALVKLTNLAADAEPAATQISNSAGQVAFRIPRRSNWQLNVVWTEPLDDNPRADFDTTFSSLTFGFGPPPAS